jgi:glc operon protein GlcG
MQRSSFRILSLVALITWSAATIAQPPPSPPRALTLDLAMRAMAAAVAYADRNDWANITIAITDDAGVPVYVQRRGTAAPGTFTFAMSKNRVVVETGLTSAGYGERVRAGEIEEIEGGVTFGGGVPIMRNGELIGAIAVSGLPPADDELVAQAGANAIAAGN